MPTPHLSLKHPLTLIFLGFASHLQALNHEEPVEVTCGVVYSVGAFPAHGGWPGQIFGATGDPARQNMFHLFYAPFLQLHNPNNFVVSYGVSQLRSGIDFNTPALGIQFERLTRTSTGFLGTQATGLSNTFVHFSYQKQYDIILSDEAGTRSVSLQPGETKIYTPPLPADYTFAADLPDGNVLYDWRSDKTNGVAFDATHGWRGPSFAFHADWLVAAHLTNATNANLSIISTRLDDTWNVEITKTGDLEGGRVFRYPSAPGPSWPMTVPDDLEITSFPYQTEDTFGSFSTADVFNTNLTTVASRQLQPIISVIIPISPGSLNAFTDRDLDGMDDYWERKHFGDLSASPSSNGDGDRDSNLIEFLTGTSPVDGNDHFRAKVIQTSEGMELQWGAIPWRHYEIQSSIDLSSWIAIRNIYTRGSNLSLRTESIDPTGADEMYYRVRVSR